MMTLQTIRKSRLAKVIALFLAIEMMFQIAMPTQALALNSGPSSPEFTSFEPVATTDMVDLSSGDFTYNLPVISIPGPDGAGYALSLSYHSGDNNETESSWVGHGWTLNPGAINRGANGIPDDYNGSEISKFNKTRPNWSATVNRNLHLEITSKDLKKKAKKNNENPDYIASVGASFITRFNNYKGFLRTRTFDASAYGMGVSASVTGDAWTFSPQINLAKLLKLKSKKFQALQKKLEGKTKQGEKFLKKLLKKCTTKAKKDILNGLTNTLAPKFGTSNYGMFKLSGNSYGVGSGKYLGREHKVDFSLQINPANAPIGIEFQQGVNVNYQVFVPKQDLKAYGYMHNQTSSDMYGSGIYEEYDDGSELHAAVSDYYIEKDVPYHKRNKFIGVPFASPDNFMVTGAGVMGGFRHYKDEIGTFFPTGSKNKQGVYPTGLEVMVGPNVGVGLDFNFGKKTETIKEWKDLASIPDNDGGEGFFRFNGDPGGIVKYTDEDLLVGEIGKTNLVNIPGSKSYGIQAGINVEETEKNRSSFIVSNTIDDINDNLESRANLEEKRDVILDFTEEIRQLNDLKDRVHSFTTYNETGQRYVYGLPVFVRNQAAISFGVDNLSFTEDGDIQNFHKYEAHNEDVDALLSNKSVIGDLKKSPYANTYLLTEITGPNYIDINDDGPDESDFGAWTKFDYKKKYGYVTDEGTGNSWFKYRAPYNGYTYSPGQLSDKKDDMLAYSSGEKEVYYLKAIETKSHIAFFVTNESSYNERFGDYFTAENPATAEMQAELTGSGVERTDGIEASATAGASKLEKGSKTLEKLEKIVLFSKERLDRPIKVVKFEYDNSLVPNIPNSTSTEEGNNGKLTLKQVSFEHNGVKDAKIPPYEFAYEYKTVYEGIDQTKYADIINYGLNNTPGNTSDDPDQNPDYLLATDMWGNYQNNGEERRSKLQPWVSQKDELPENDIAAWQLKQITLPTGGQILIQYEQDDYTHVQNRPAEAMVSLEAYTNNDDDNDYDPDDYKFTLNLEDLGYTSDDFTADPTLIDSLYQHFRARLLNESIYFKFLYALKGNATPTIENCTSEYITGYAIVDNVNKEGNKIVLELGNDNGSGTSGALEKKNMPRQICYEYYLHERGGMLASNCDCDDDKFRHVETLFRKRYHEATENMSTTMSNTDVHDDVDDEFFSSINLIIPLNGTEVNLMALSYYMQKDFSLYKAPKKKKVCKHVNPELSYLRVPLYKKAKKGGGLRVKRLMMYDRGIETGQEVLYGKEYHYVDRDGLSSGVASNEPSAGREENPMVGLLKRNKQSTYDKIVSGLDRQTMEGPLGESILPGPSVIYSRIVESNIHTGKTSPGFVVHEFNTYRDYPNTIKYSSIDAGNFMERLTDPSPYNKRDRLRIGLGIINYSVDKVWLSQGYRFYQNAMNGTPKGKYTYHGSYTLEKGQPFSPYQDKLSAYEEYEYYKMGEPVNVLSFDGQSYQLEKELPGYEEQIAMEMKTVEEKYWDISLEFDISASATYIMPAAFPSFTFDETEGNYFRTSKIVNFPSILKKKKTNTDGLYTEQEFLAFDKNTGKPILTKSYDAYNEIPLVDASTQEEYLHEGAVYSWSIPAAWMYPELGQMAEDIHNQNALSAVAGQIVTYGAEGNPLSNTGHAIRPNLPQYITVYDMANNIIAPYRLNEQGNPEPMSMSSSGEALKRYDINNPEQPYDEAGNMIDIYREAVAEDGSTIFQKVEFYDVNGGPAFYDPSIVDNQAMLYKDNLAQEPVFRTRELQPSFGANGFNNVISASAQTFKKDWYTIQGEVFNFYNLSELPSAKLAELNSLYKPHKSYAYHSKRTASHNDTGDPQIYNNTGVYTGTAGTNFTLFNWADPDNNNNWIAASEVEFYSPNGTALQEKNALDIRTAVRLSNKDMMPSIIGQNADFASINFFDFEEGNYDAAKAHTGYQAYNLISNNNTFETNVTLSSQLLEEGAIVSVWLNSAFSNSSLQENFDPEFSVSVAGGEIAPMKRVAHSGEWTLYEAQITNWGQLQAGSSTSITLVYTPESNESVYLDDVKIQPANSEAVCYVYDVKDYKLLAQLDDRHFATIFKYNDEGQLAKKIIETEKGRKMVQETQSNTRRIQE